MKWSEEIMRLRSRNCSTEPIWDKVPQLLEHIELLNSEKRIADEGIIMHHCIYTVYNNSLKHKRTIAFHVKDERDYTVMFHFSYGNNVEFEQAYHAWNQPLSDKLMEEAKSLIKFAQVIYEMNKG